jgi:hypothetical protein
LEKNQIPGTNFDKLRTAAAAIASAFLGFEPSNPKALTFKAPLVAEKWEETVSIIN